MSHISEYQIHFLFFELKVSVKLIIVGREVENVVQFSECNVCLCSFCNSQHIKEFVWIVAPVKRNWDKMSTIYHN